MKMEPIRVVLVVEVQTDVPTPNWPNQIKDSVEKELRLRLGTILKEVRIMTATVHPKEAP
jgi:hypothetical protein